MSDYPVAITAVNHVEPVPRRIRAFLGGEQVLDTSRALYVWEWPNFYNEQVDVILDGQRLDRPQTQFFASNRASPQPRP
jgi:uncharacterized protein (DUF427 family)